MTPTDERAKIVSAVESIRRRCRRATEPSRRGPVSLSQCLEEFNLIHAALPGLTRAGVYDHLLEEGMTPGDLGDDEALAGFLYVTSSVGVVFVNADDPVPRRRFTAAHELGHFVLHRQQMSATGSIGDTAATVVEVEGEKVSVMEREANWFAAELLMPAEACRARAAAFRKEYRCCPLSAFAYHLAAELLVSPEAMRYRLRHLGVSDE